MYCYKHSKLIIPRFEFAIWIIIFSCAILFRNICYLEYLIDDWLSFVPWDIYYYCSNLGCIVYKMLILNDVVITRLWDSCYFSRSPWWYSTCTMLVVYCKYFCVTKSIVIMIVINSKVCSSRLDILLYNWPFSLIEL